MYPPFDRLRANGGNPKIVEDFPFVLSLSKHERHLLGTFHLGNLYDRVLSRRLGTAKPDIGGAGARLAFSATANQVTSTVTVATEVRPAARDSFRDARFEGINTGVRTPPRESAKWRQPQRPAL